MKKIINLYLNRRFIFELLGLLLICLTPAIYKDISVDGLYANLLVSILYAFPILCILSSIKNKYIYYIVTFVFMIMSFIETMMVLLYGNYLTSGNLLAIIGTNQDEGLGFIKGTISELLFALPVLIGWLIAIKVRSTLIPYFARIILFFVSSSIVCAVLTFQIKYKWNNNITTEFYVEQNILGRPPYNFLFQTYNAISLIKQREYIKESAQMTFNAVRPVYNESEIYVLAIGESLRYDNLSIIGYKRSTTPLIESIENVVLYNNYYSTANLTMYSVPQILTRATPDNFVLNYKEKSIYKPFQECGFKTYVICAGNLLNQEKYLSEGCDSLICLSANDDDKIASVIDSLVLKDKKVFCIVQFAGNHGPYKNFRKEQDKYHPNPVSDNVGWDNHEAMVNAYDNTVLFTDYNIYNIIKTINKPNVLSSFLMVSDHGADYDTGVSDHGGNCNPRKAEYHVPLIFWYSKGWEEKHKAKKDIFISHRNLPVNADNIFYSVCDMADITIEKKYSKPEWSLFSSKFELHKRFLLVPDGKNTIEVK